MKKTHTPFIPEFENINHEKVNMGDAVNYMNSVIKYYGPPCNVFCKHFSESICECEKGHKIREYAMELGPYERWYIRKKKCSDIEPKSDTEQQEATNRLNLDGMALDCFYQQYCGHR
jgi:hypothetical protein